MKKSIELHTITPDKQIKKEFFDPAVEQDVTSLIAKLTDPKYPCEKLIFYSCSVTNDLEQILNAAAQNKTLTAIKTINCQIRGKEINRVKNVIRLIHPCSEGLTPPDGVLKKLDGLLSEILVLRNTHITSIDLISMRQITLTKFDYYRLDSFNRDTSNQEIINVINEFLKKHQITKPFESSAKIPDALKHAFYRLMYEYFLQKSANKHRVKNLSLAIQYLQLLPEHALTSDDRFTLNQHFLALARYIPEKKEAYVAQAIEILKPISNKQDSSTDKNETISIPQGFSFWSTPNPFEGLRNSLTKDQTLQNRIAP